MEQIAAFLVDNPLYLAAAAVMAVMILLVMLKKLFKTAVIVSSVFVLYVAYLYWTGEDASQTVLHIESVIRDGLRMMVDFLKSLGK